jgi:hypothetical protein
MNGFYIEAIKWRAHSPIDWKHPIKSYLCAAAKLSDCKHIKIKLVRSNRTKNTGNLVFQIDGFELPHGDFA